MIEPAHALTLSGMLVVLVAMLVGNLDFIAKLTMLRLTALGLSICAIGFFLMQEWGPASICATLPGVLMVLMVRPLLTKQTSAPQALASAEFHPAQRETAQAQGVTEMTTEQPIIRPHSGRITVIAIVLSIVMLAAYAIIFVVPAAKTVEMPFFGGTTHEFVFNISWVILVLWIMSNIFSGRWAPDHLLKYDDITSRITFWGMMAIVVLVGISLSFRDFDLGHALLFILTPTLAFIDVRFLKSIEHRSSMMQGENARLVEENHRLGRQVVALTEQLHKLQPDLIPAIEPEIGPYMPFVGQLADQPIMVEGLYLVTLDRLGCITITADLSKDQVEAIFYGEINRRRAQPAPRVVPPPAAAVVPPGMATSAAAGP